MMPYIYPSLIALYTRDGQKCEMANNRRVSVSNQNRS